MMNILTDGNIVHGNGNPIHPCLLLGDGGGGGCQTAQTGNNTPTQHRSDWLTHYTIRRATSSNPPGLVRDLKVQTYLKSGLS